jgi:hypothetical protein
MGHIEALAMAMFMFGLLVGIVFWNDSKDSQDGGWGDVIGFGVLIAYFFLVIKLGWLAATGLLLLGFAVMVVHWNCEIRSIMDRDYRERRALRRANTMRRLRSVRHLLPYAVKAVIVTGMIAAGLHLMLRDEIGPLIGLIAIGGFMLRCITSWTTPPEVHNAH